MTLLDAAKDAKKFCDINLRKDCYSAESVISSIERADVVKLNQDEVIEVVRMLSPAPLSDGTNPAEASRELFEIIKARKSAIELVVTLGAQGALAFDVAGTLYHHPGYHISPGRDADTVGSGDAFAAAYVKNRMSGASIDQALAEGNRAGALVACQRGALCEISATERLREQSRAHMPQSHNIECPRVIEP
jgi:fructokinase